MSREVLYLFFLVLAPALARNFPGFLLRTPSKEEHRTFVEENVGPKLIVTGYLESGKVGEARNLSRVAGQSFPEDIPSYAGFFTVNSTHDSNLFYWFFPAEHDYENAPVILWLQGGPGASSLYGLFNEVGPFSVSADGGSLVRNPYSWHKNHSIVFIDSPVGTGFSFTNNSSGYATNQLDVGRDLYSALLQFFTMFPELQKNSFFVAGESYAGKYVPAIAHTIHVNKQNAAVNINLKGLVIGDGLVDPVNMLHYSDMVYQWGLVDNATWTKMQGYEDSTAKYIEKGEYRFAQTMWENDLSTFQYKADVSVYNILEDNGGTDSTYAKIFLNDTVRSAIHVGSQQYHFESDTVYSYLLEDIMKSVRPWVEDLLDSGYRVVFYNGQLDVICGYSLTVKMLEALQFNAAQEYRTASRKLWNVNNKLAGYTKTAGNMTEVLVRNAGHMVPGDQPAAAFDLIYKTTRNQAF